MSKEREHYTAEEKVAVLRRHLLDKVPNLSGTFYTCAASWMDTAASSCIGTCGSR